MLVYDRPIGNDVLRWSDLQQWWSETEQIADATQAKRSPYVRSKARLPHKSPPQSLLFNAFFVGFRGAVQNLPALLREVWLHWGPRTVKERGRDALPRFRIDFLLLLPQGARVVIELEASTTARTSRGASARNTMCSWLEATADSSSRDMKFLTLGQ
ncbi:hypothetical protein [Paraburkholderia sp. J41]|uniref:hypothetical protein n=1 Tax=Paraburkholderia sp. J41 TaxID=2805433 RepID=UPI002AC315AC|nr:hypothetical protein [Paraburkholderia sp. J41]